MAIWRSLAAGATLGPSNDEHAGSVRFRLVSFGSWSLQAHLGRGPGSIIRDPTLRVDYAVVSASAEFFVRKGKYVEAEKLYRESCKLRANHEKDVPVSMRGFDWTQVDLAACLFAEGKTSEAEPIYRDALSALKGDQHLGNETRFKVFDGTLAAVAGKRKGSG